MEAVKIISIKNSANQEKYNHTILKKWIRNANDKFTQESLKANTHKNILNMSMTRE